MLILRICCTKIGLCITREVFVAAMRMINRLIIPISEETLEPLILLWWLTNFKRVTIP